MLRTLKALAHDEDGAELTEYVLLATFIAMVALVAVKRLGTDVSTFFNSAATSI